MNRSAVGESGLTVKEKPWSMQGSDAWPSQDEMWSSAKRWDSSLPPGKKKPMKVANEIDINPTRIDALNRAGEEYIQVPKDLSSIFGKSGSADMEKEANIARLLGALASRIGRSLPTRGNRMAGRAMSTGNKSLRNAPAKKLTPGQQAAELQAGVPVQKPKPQPWGPDPTPPPKPASPGPANPSTLTPKQRAANANPYQSPASTPTPKPGGPGPAAALGLAVPATIAGGTQAGMANLMGGQPFYSRAYWQNLLDGTGDWGGGAFHPGMGNRIDENSWDNYDRRKGLNPDFESWLERNKAGAALSSAARGFLDRCAEKNLNEFEILHAVKEASALSPEIADDLEPLLKEANFLRGLMGLFGRGGGRAAARGAAQSTARGMGQGMTRRGFMQQMMGRGRPPARPPAPRAPAPRGPIPGQPRITGPTAPRPAPTAPAAPRGGPGATPRPAPATPRPAPTGGPPLTGAQVQGRFSQMWNKPSFRPGGGGGAPAAAGAGASPGTSLIVRPPGMWQRMGQGIAQSRVGQAGNWLLNSKSLPADMLRGSASFGAGGAGIGATTDLMYGQNPFAEGSNMRRFGAAGLLAGPMWRAGGRGIGRMTGRPMNPNTGWGGVVSGGPRTALGMAGFGGATALSDNILERVLPPSAVAEIRQASEDMGIDLTQAIVQDPDTGRYGLSPEIEQLMIKRLGEDYQFMGRPITDYINQETGQLDVPPEVLQQIMAGQMGQYFAENPEAARAATEAGFLDPETGQVDHERGMNTIVAASNMFNRMEEIKNMPDGPEKMQAMQELAQQLGFEVPEQFQSMLALQESPIGQMISGFMEMSPTQQMLLIGGVLTAVMGLGSMMGGGGGLGMGLLLGGGLLGGLGMFGGNLFGGNQEGPGGGGTGGPAAGAGPGGAGGNPPEYGVPGGLPGPPTLGGYREEGPRIPADIGEPAQRQVTVDPGEVTPTQ